MSRTLLSPLPLGKCASHISCALPAMNRPLPAELKFRENTGGGGGKMSALLASGLLLWTAFLERWLSLAQDKAKF